MVYFNEDLVSYIKKSDATNYMKNNFLELGFYYINSKNLISINTRDVNDNYVLVDMRFIGSDEITIEVKRSIFKNFLKNLKSK